MADADEELLSSGEVARRIGVSVNTVGAWVRRGWLKPAIRTAGGQYRFRMSEVLRDLEQLRDEDPD
jgi:excisionase family DNA binding protein